MVRPWDLDLDLDFGLTISGTRIVINANQFYFDIWMDNDAVATDSHLVDPKVCFKVIILMAVFLDPFLEIAHLGQKTVDLLPLSR